MKRLLTGTTILPGTSATFAHCMCFRSRSAELGAMKPRFAGHFKKWMAAHVDCPVSQGRDPWVGRVVPHKCFYLVDLSPRLF
jgi:hypothetical protein